MKAEQEVTALEQNVSQTPVTKVFTPLTCSFCPNIRVSVGPQVTRLEGHVTRYRSAAENAEKVEDELKAEKRKLQREVTLGSGKVLMVLGKF